MSHRSRLALAPLAAALAFLPGCPLLAVEVRVPEVCINYDHIDVDGAPGDQAATAHKTIVIDDLSAIHQITDLDADVSFVRSEIVALAGISDFAWVQSAKITVTAGDLPPLVLYQCDGDCAPTDGALDMTPEAQRDALAYLRGDSVTIDVELAGSLPRDAWAMSVAVCFEANARYQYER